MADGLERDEFRQWLELLRADIKGVHDRLDAINGRTRTAEQSIAVLQDRSCATDRNIKLWGGALAAILALLELAQVFHR